MGQISIPSEVWATVTAIVSAIGAWLVGRETLKRARLSEQQDDLHTYWQCLRDDVDKLRAKVDDQAKQLEQSRIEMTDLVAWVRVLMVTLPPTHQIPKPPSSITHLIDLGGSGWPSSPDHI